MTIADDQKFCNSCKKVGLQRKAHRIMPGEGGAQCDEHFRDISGLPQLNEVAKRFIAQCKAKLADPEIPIPHPPGSGAPAVPKLRKKRGPYKKKEPPAAGAVTEAQRQFRVPMSVRKSSDKYDDVIVDLRKKRADHEEAISKIDKAIACLSEMRT